MSQREKQSTLSVTEMAKLEDLLHRKIANLACKEDMTELRSMFEPLKDKIAYQDRKIAALELRIK